MRIGFDLDNVFINTPPFLPYSAIEYFYKKETKKRLEYRIPKNPELILRRISHLTPFRPPMEKNISFLRGLSRSENDLYLITSRFGFLEKRTTALLHRLGLDRIFHGMFFNYQDQQPHVFKSEILKKLDLDRYIDDDLDLLKYVAKHNKKTKYFWLNPKYKKQLSHNIFAITDIADILS